LFSRRVGGIFPSIISPCLAGKNEVSKNLKQHQVLFVDDDPDFLQLLAELFGPMSQGTWQIHRATSADAALNFLQNHPVDLIVVDINMAVLDGVQFLRILQRRYSDLKKVTLTAFATEEKRNECLANGAELFIEKPRAAEGLRSIFVMLDELLNWAPKEGFQGMLRKVGLSDVIQMECLGRNSSVLEISNRQTRGRIYIEDGVIIHAAVGEANGEKAFQKILCLTGGSFQLLPFEKPAQRTIEGPWEFLLMEAARVRDETASQPVTESEPPAEESPVRAVPAVHIAETLICSGHGEILHNYQSANPAARTTLFKDVAQQAERMSQILPLGKFDRLEIQLANGRAIVQARADRRVFVLVNHEVAPHE
jgi:CheY-like chemotaxis protein